MKRLKKAIVLLTLFALGTQSYADVLQAAVSASHATPKVINQTENSTTSQSLEINPYGKLRDVNQEQAEVIGIDFDQNPFIYGSGYHDIESNLEYMGARYYSADIGRFMAQDSYDLINRYNYANANPIMYVDPDGHFAISDLFPHSTGGWIGMVGGIAVGGLLAGLTGGLSSLTLTGSLIAGIGEGAASGAVGDAVGQGIDQGFDKINWVEVGMSAAIGGVLGGVSSGKFKQRQMRLTSNKELSAINSEFSVKAQIKELLENKLEPFILEDDQRKGLFLLKKRKYSFEAAQGKINKQNLILGGAENMPNIKDFLLTPDFSEISNNSLKNIIVEGKKSIDEIGRKNYSLKVIQADDFVIHVMYRKSQRLGRVEYFSPEIWIRDLVGRTDLNQGFIAS